MRRLSDRQTHVMWQIIKKRVSVRQSLGAKAPYSYCIDCGSVVSKQTNALMDRGLIEFWVYPASGVTGRFELTATGKDYFERHMR